MRDCDLVLLEPLSSRVPGTFSRFLCGALEILVVSPNMFWSLSPFFAASPFVSHFWKCFPMWLGGYRKIYSCTVTNGLMPLGLLLLALYVETLRSLVGRGWNDPKHRYQVGEERSHGTRPQLIDRLYMSLQSLSWS